MATIKISPEAEKKAKDVLKQMLIDGKSEGKMPEPFSDFKVILGRQEGAWMIFPIPEDLKKQVNGEDLFSVIPLDIPKPKTSI